MGWGGGGAGSVEPRGGGGAPSNHPILTCVCLSSFLVVINQVLTCILVWVDSLEHALLIALVHLEQCSLTPDNLFCMPSLGPSFFLVCVFLIF